MKCKKHVSVDCGEDSAVFHVELTEGKTIDITVERDDDSFTAVVNALSCLGFDVEDIAD